MPPEIVLLLYLVSLLAAVCLSALYYDRRRKRFTPTPSEDRVFRCSRCAFVYTDDADIDHSRCPQCGAVNEAIRF